MGRQTLKLGFFWVKIINRCRTPPPPPPLPVIKIYISQSWTSVEMLELQDSEARIGSLANLVDQLSDCSYKVQVKVKVMWCIYIAPFPFGCAQRRFTMIGLPPADRKHIYTKRAVNVCWYSFYRPRK